MGFACVCVGGIGKHCQVVTMPAEKHQTARGLASSVIALCQETSHHFALAESTGNVTCLICCCCEIDMQLGYQHVVKVDLQALSGFHLKLHDL